MSADNAPEKEASITFTKFFRLLKLRWLQQGARITAFWTVNFFASKLIGRPIRRFAEITPHLFVGGQFRRRGWHNLRGWGISAVVNLRREFDDRKLKVAMPAYLYLPTRDDDAPTLAHLKSGSDFISDHISRGGKIYIHCGSGVGRAATLAAAYLISEGMQPYQAWQAIRSKRPFIRPTRVQRAQVERFFHDLHKASIPPKE